MEISLGVDLFALEIEFFLFFYDSLEHSFWVHRINQTETIMSPCECNCHEHDNWQANTVFWMISTYRKIIRWIRVMIFCEWNSITCKQYANFSSYAPHLVILILFGQSLASKFNALRLIFCQTPLIVSIEICHYFIFSEEKYLEIAIFLYLHKSVVSYQM